MTSALQPGCSQCKGAGQKGLFGPRGFGGVSRTCETCSGAGLSDEGMAALRALEGGDEMSSRLLRVGKGLEGKNFTGCTALLDAARFGHRDAVSILLMARASVQARTKNGRTALELAQRREHHDVAIMLQRSGARRGSNRASRAAGIIRPDSSENAADFMGPSPCSSKGSGAASRESSPCSSKSSFSAWSRCRVPRSRGHSGSPSRNPEAGEVSIVPVKFGEPRRPRSRSLSRTSSRQSVRDVPEIELRQSVRDVPEVELP